MTSYLYLDTARLGRMCPEAQAADRDFARFAGDEGCSLYFERFLRWGYTGLPPTRAHRYPALAFWAGVTPFKHDLRTVLGLPRERHVLIANRSAQLVRLAARLLCLRCENILVTDMEWPAYMRTLTTEAGRRGREVTVVPLYDSVFRQKNTQEQLVRRLADEYRRQNCDGLFLSAVTYRGVRLPIRELVAALSDRDRPRFVVVDGAQALNHVPLGLQEEYCDLLLAGCHKWLRAYQPLGLTCCCRASSEGFASAVCQEMLDSGELDDPLLSFTRQLETDRLQAFSETVNISPLFTAAAAVRRMVASGRSKRAELECQLDNADGLAECAEHAGWRPVRPSNPLHTGILLLEAARLETQSAPVDILRERFLTAGVALTAYDGGLVRASLPDRLLSRRRLDALHAALCRCA